MWWIYIIVFMLGTCLGCIGMAIVACGARADDRRKIDELIEQMKDWKSKHGNNEVLP